MFIYLYMYIHRRADGSIYIYTSQKVTICSLWTVCPCFKQFPIEKRTFSLFLLTIRGTETEWVELAGRELGPIQDGERQGHTQHQHQQYLQIIPLDVISCRLFKGA